jgi:hypothetical protein
MPCCSVSGRRASARPRRVNDARRSRNVALRRLQSMEGSLPPPLLQNRACRRVGRQRGTLRPFSNGPPPNEPMSLSISGRSPVTTFEQRSNDGQVCYGSPHLAYLTAPGHRVTCSPSPALPPTGSPGRWSTSQRHTLRSVCVTPLQRSNWVIWELRRHGPLGL